MLRFLIYLLFVTGLSACVHVQHLPRPVILLLEDARTEWANLPDSVRDAFTDTVQIRVSSVDEIIKNPLVLDSVIGFISSDLSIFEPIRYLSNDPFDEANPDFPLHLFRRKSLSISSAENLKPFFEYLASTSPRIRWSSPPSREEIFENEMALIRLERILEDTPIGDFNPASNKPMDLFKALETVTRNAGADFKDPLYYVPDTFHQNIEKYMNPRAERLRFDFTPDTTLLEALTIITERYHMHYWVQSGRIWISPNDSPDNRRLTYRVNPSQLSAWTYWSVQNRYLEQSDFNMSNSDEEDPFREGVFAPDPSWVPPKVPPDIPEPPPVFDIFGFLTTISEATEMDENINSFFGYGVKFRRRNAIRWRAPDGLSINLCITEIKKAEDLLYLIQTTSPGK